MDGWPVQTAVAAGGFAIGLVFGGIVQHTGFCTMGGISDALFLSDRRRLRAWFLAIAVAVAGTTLLQAAGLVDIGRAFYLAPSLGWVGAILGGLAFGVGMTFTGGCGSRNVARLGAGSLKALVVLLVLGLFAGMTLRGLIAPLRAWLERSAGLDLGAVGAARQGVPDLIAAAAGGEPGMWRLACALAFAGGLAAWCLKDAAFRATPSAWLGGTLIGALVVCGWMVTGILGADEFEPQPLVSLTFIAPVGDGLLYLMTFTGAALGFGVAAVGGAIIGAGLVAAATGSFRIETFRDRGDMVRHVTGGALMGVGGVLALGCTIGQGITGLSTLAVGSFLAWGGIVAGAILGLRILEHGSLRAALRALRGAPVSGPAD